MSESVCGILIASGYSERMGRLKALLDIGGVSFITGILLKMALVCDKVIVVLGHEKTAIEEQLNGELLMMSGSESATLRTASKNAVDKLETIFNESYDDGMFTSLQRGIGKALDYSRVLYHFVDQPAIPKSFYYELTEQADENCGWIQPVYGERSGHPLLISSSLFEIIRSADPGDNLRNILTPRKESRCLWQCDYAEILEDIDTIEDYNDLKSRGYSILEDLLK